MMRWVFIDPNDPEEVAIRNEMLRRIDAWWHQFQTKTQALSDLFTRRAQWDLPQWMSDHLGAIHPRLMWEYGPPVKSTGHRLVITPESARWLRPLLRTILERAPQIPGWEFYGYRLPESNPEYAQATLHGRTGGDLRTMRVAPRVGEGRKIDLYFAMPDCTGPDDDAAMQKAFVASETLLGEYMLDTWIGGIEVAPLPYHGGPVVFGNEMTVDPARMIPVERLKPTVDSVSGSIVEQLPPEPCYASLEGRQFATIELGPPDEYEDYPRRSDLLIASTCHLEMWQAAHSSGTFNSACHTRNRETFCYLKMHTPDGPHGNSVEQRGEIEDALNDALVPARAGCTIGGGTGLQYAYIDLAVVNLQQTVAITRDVLRRHNVHLRSWLLFFDDTWEYEWIGIYDQTALPPMYDPDEA